MASDLSERLEKCYTGAVHDVMRGMGFRDFVLPPSIRPLILERRLCGPAFTVRGRVEPSADAHRTLVEWTGLLSRAKPGTVVVCQPNDSVVAHMGELSAETLQLRGIRGYIVDGGCRDTDGILKLGFPVWCRYFTPRDVVGYWVPDAIEVPITIGSVTIRSGDSILADRDGAVVIPQADAEKILARTEEIMARENLVRNAIRQGMDPQQAYLQHGKF